MQSSFSAAVQRLLIFLFPNLPFLQLRTRYFLQ